MQKYPIKSVTEPAKNTRLCIRETGLRMDLPLDCCSTGYVQKPEKSASKQCVFWALGGQKKTTADSSRHAKSM